MLREILLRLPPEPSSLPRASAVCRRWRGIVIDPKFHRQFRAHHRKPPLLGFFKRTYEGIMFMPVLDLPDRIPPQRFDLGRNGSREHTVLNCRHGLVLVNDHVPKEVLVCDPITGEQHRLVIPPELRRAVLGGAVLCAASDLGHVHGSCHETPFKVGLVSTGASENEDLACVYSSESDAWGDLILTEVPYEISPKPAVLVGNCLYWLSMGGEIIEFDLGQDSLYNLDQRASGYR